MNNRSRYELILVVLLPILAAMIGGTFIYGGFRSFSGLGMDPIDKGMIGPFEIYFGCSLLLGILSLLYRYLRTPYYWLVPLVLSIVYSIFISRNTVYQIGMTKAFIPIFLLSIVLSLITCLVFFNSRFMQFRTMVFGILSAISMAAYFRLVLILMNVPAEPGFWMNRFVSSLFLFIFVGFGMSFADLIVVKAELKRMPSLSDDADDEDETEVDYSEIDDDDK